MDQPQVNDQIKSAIKAKLKELGTYVDDELPGRLENTIFYLVEIERKIDEIKTKVKIRCLFSFFLSCSLSVGVRRRS